MKWKYPPITKIYEAIGAVADGRVEISKNSGKVYSSRRNKFYDISYDPKSNSIMSNDNASYWQGYLGYPAIAFLLKSGILPYDPKIGELLEGIIWKDVNQKFKNDFEKALESILSSKSEEDRKPLVLLADKIAEEIKRLDLNMLGKKTLPPKE